MTNDHPSDTPKSGPRKRRFLCAEKRFQIYQEAQSTDKPVGELLHEGAHLPGLDVQIDDRAVAGVGATPWQPVCVVAEGLEMVSPGASPEALRDGPAFDDHRSGRAPGFLREPGGGLFPEAVSPGRW